MAPDVVMHREEREQLQGVIGHLTRDQREFLEVYYFRGQTFSKIAAMRKTTTQSVMTLRDRGLANARIRLDAFNS